MGEMIFSKTLLSGRNRSERARLRQAPNETCFGAIKLSAYVTCCLSADLALLKQRAAGLSGAQMATKTIDEGVRCSVLAAEAGASWIDLNCGCESFVLVLCMLRCSGAKLLRPAQNGCTCTDRGGAARQAPYTRPRSVALGRAYLRSAR